MLAERERRLKGISGLIATVFLAAACSPTSNGGNEGNLTASQPIETTPITIINPTHEPAQTPKEKSVDEKAKEAMFNAWINNSLNSGVQKTKEDFLQGTNYLTASMLKVEATNINTWQEQENLILNNGQSNEALQISWAGGAYRYDKANPNGAASKYFGQIEINNAQINESSGFSISDADKANGITWHGSFNISYIERYHSKTYWMAQGDYKKLESWITEFDNTDLPNFTPWYQTSYQSDVVLQNGKWILKQPQSSTRLTSNNLIKGFIVPYDTKEDISTVCGTSCEGDFQTKIVK